MRPFLALAFAWLLGLWVPGGGPAWLAVAALLSLVALTRRGWLALLPCAFAAAHGIVAASGPPSVPGLGPHDGVVVRPVQVDAYAGLRRVVVDLDDPPLRVQVADGSSGGPLPLPGDRVRFAGEVRAPRGWRNPGAYDRARSLLARGVEAVATARPPGIARLATPAPSSTWRLAAEAQRALSAPFAGGGDGPALLRALVAGDRRALAPSLEDAFRRTGTAHVLSVSGLHLAAIAGLIYLLTRRGLRALLRRRPRLTGLLADADRAAALVAAPAAVAYALVTGAELATLRALVCVLLHFAARLLGRHTDALTTLAAAALLLTALEPASAHDPSFQLTFAATATLVVAGRRLAGRPLAVRVLGTSAAVWCVTAPIGALHFGQLHPMGLVANVVVVPIAEIVLLPAGLAAALVGQLWTLPADAVGWAAGLVAAGVRALAAVAPAWDVPPPTPAEGILFALAVAGVIHRRAALAAACLAAIALHVAWTIVVAPALATSTRITFLDVGQGDSALVEVPGERWLVDAGGLLFGAPGPDAGADARLVARRSDPGEQAVWPFLRTRRIFRLDVVVISHPHPDHYGGLAALLEHVSVGEVWISGDEVADPRWQALVAELGRRGIPVRVPPVGEARRSGGARLTILAPRGADPALGVNDNSLVARVDFAGRRVLFAGDLEASGEDLLLAEGDVRADVVKVPHHGSRTSSSPAFVAATHPTLAVVSCGADNLWGFPAAEVVARWRAAGAEVRTTADEGAISAEIDAAGVVHLDH